MEGKSPEPPYYLHLFVKPYHSLTATVAGPPVPVSAQQGHVPLNVAVAKTSLNNRRKSGSKRF